ncbi:Fic family protein [Pseudomonas neuropathica]|uniref:Fic family protein n=1 Tax=Pseudomonas neuropathica TaxID=2730425 RepID=UPI003EB7B264
MCAETVLGTHWLEPLMPVFPNEILHLAEQVPFQAGKLSAMVSPPMLQRVGGLLRVTSSFYSNLIEGQFAEPVTLAPTSPKRQRKELTELAMTHIGTQQAFERALSMHKSLPWEVLFSPAFVARLHKRLFYGAREDQLMLSDGSPLVPGELRDVRGREVLVGNHSAPPCQSVSPMLARMQNVYGRLPDARSRLLSVMAYHHRLAWVHPFIDGNGRTIRLLTHLQLQKLGLVSPLWSLSRGLARQQGTYYARLANADKPRRGDLDGRGQLTQAGLFEFVGFMLETCLDQMRYTERALNISNMRERLHSIFVWHERVKMAGIKPEAARALHVLLTQGTLSRADFKIFTGLSDRVATDQLKGLVQLGLVESATPKARDLYPGLPIWFAQLLFPDLHQRMNAAT